MPTRVDDYRESYVWDLSEQHGILIGVLAVAERMEDAALAAEIRPALEQVNRAMDLHGALVVGQEATPERGEAMQIDREIDELVAFIYDVLAAIARSPAHPLQSAARTLLALAFPQGLAVYIRAAFVDQRSSNLRLVSHLGGPQAAPIVDALLLRPALQRLQELADRFATAMRAPVEVDREAVEAAKALAGEMTYHVIDVVKAAHAVTDPAQVARRDELLAEARATQARMRARFVELGRKGQATRAAREASARAACEAGVPPAPPTGGAPSEGVIS